MQKILCKCQSSLSDLEFQSKKKAVDNLKIIIPGNWAIFDPKSHSGKKQNTVFAYPKKMFIGQKNQFLFRKNIKSCHTPSSSCEIEIIWRGEGRPRSKIGNSISRPVFYFFDRNMCEIACFSSPKIFSGSLRWPLNTAPKKKGGGGICLISTSPPTKSEIASTFSAPLMQIWLYISFFFTQKIE